MREYHARFFGEVWTQFKLFGKEQVVVGALAAIIQIASDEGQTGTIGPTAVLPSVIAAVSGYGVVCLVKLAWIAVHAPVELDQRRVGEIQIQKENAEQQITLAREDAREQHFGRVNAEAALQEERSRKHPHDEHLDHAAYEAVAKLNGQGFDC